MTVYEMVKFLTDLSMSAKTEHTSDKLMDIVWEIGRFEGKIEKLTKENDKLTEDNKFLSSYRTNAALKLAEVTKLIDSIQHPPGCGCIVCK